MVKLQKKFIKKCQGVFLIQSIYVYMKLIFLFTWSSNLFCQDWINSQAITFFNFQENATSNFHAFQVCHISDAFQWNSIILTQHQANRKFVVYEFASPKCNRTAAMIFLCGCFPLLMETSLCHITHSALYHPRILWA